MKTNNILIALCLLIMSGLWTACSKSVNEMGDLAPQTPASLDLDAGRWQPVLLRNGGEMALEAPAAPNSADYARELQAAKTAVGQLTDEQRTIIRYWEGGGILRWNQIMRELVAKYNLPPVANDDGTYPIPNANNPFAYPAFPFANPPYAARAYAYVTVAQYDALVAAYFYKAQYGRQAPYQYDNSLQPATRPSTLPSYPCEDAVMSAVTLELMKLLFPAEIPYLEAKAAEQRNYKLWAGAAVRSDVEAGEKLGKAVAERFVARARTDGMRNAVGTPAQWDSLARATRERGEIPWLSLETPARPPMLPFFGRVRPWLFDAKTLVEIRPVAPPSTNSEAFRRELAEVKEEAARTIGNRDRTAIVHFWADGVGTYTPPGHWNAIAADLVIGARQSEIRAARTFALLNMAVMDAGVSCWDTKNHYFNPRPSQMDPSIKTMTGVPNFPAYTSGHSTFSAAAATVLGHVFPADKPRLERMATEASLSRLYGGIHYRSDCEVGLRCGNTVGAFAVRRAQTDGGN